jgi:hypothetical protein
MKGMPSWPAAPNLLSFKVGDLLRCRIASHEKEIVRIYEELQTMSDKSPEKLKIIRVKNRLKSGTNDLLVNVRYNNAFTAELQLKVKTKVAHSRFSGCSYNFSHFIYEIQRSKFGPISEMCSIWNNLDPRTITYQMLIEKENLNANIGNLKYFCILSGIDHQMESLSNSPFICSNCGKSYSSDNFVLSHKNCKLCNYFKCCLCQIKERQNVDLIEDLVPDEQIRDALLPERCKAIPKSMGVCIKIESHAEDSAQLFKMVEALQKQYLFVAKGNN